MGRVVGRSLRTRFAESFHRDLAHCAGFRVGDTGGNEVVDAGHDVLQLGEAGLAQQRVAPGRPVAGRAAVVHQRDREAVVDQRRHLRAP